MPTILFVNGYRFFFYSNEHLPAHIHVESTGRTAKFNLGVVELVKSSGFNSKELKEIRTIVEENKNIFNIKWNEYFDNK